VCQPSSFPLYDQGYIFPSCKTSWDHFRSLIKNGSNLNTTYRHFCMRPLRSIRTSNPLLSGNVAKCFDSQVGLAPCPLRSQQVGGIPGIQWTFWVLKENEWVQPFFACTCSGVLEQFSSQQDGCKGGNISSSLWSKFFICSKLVVSHGHKFSD
jgi:hypothetical protein